MAMIPYHPPTGSIDVIRQDPDFYVINKPSGLLSVPGKGPEKADCVLSRLHDAGYEDAMITHRLDMETSGLMIFARHSDSHRAFGRLFETRAISKTYIALVDGHPVQHEGEIDLPLRCDWPNRPKQMVDHEQGKQALTRYQVLDRYENQTSRVALYPVTGRSHQLRVHMLSMGHAILGDPLYATVTALAKADRLCLHASELRFVPPDHDTPMNITLPAPF